MQRLARFALLMSTLGVLVGCDTLFHSGLGMAGLNTPDKQVYDEAVCKHGPASPPGTRTRDGCVNTRTVTENQADFDRYDNERRILLERGR